MEFAYYHVLYGPYSFASTLLVFFQCFVPKGLLRLGNVQTKIKNLIT